MLKTLTLTLLILQAFSGTLSYTKDENDTLSQYIRKLLEEFRKEMTTGIPELNIPPLDPLEIPEINAHIQEGVADIKLDIKSFTVGQLSKFEVTSIQADMEKLEVELELHFPQLSKAIGNYNLDGKILFFPLYGNGQAFAQIDGLSIFVRSGLDIIDMKKLQLTNLKVDAHFRNIQLYLEGIVGGGNLGDLVNTLLNGLGKMLFDQFRGLISTEISRIAQTALNQELAKIDLQDLLGGISPPTSFQVSVSQSEELGGRVNEILEKAHKEFTASASHKEMSITLSSIEGLTTLRRHGGCSVETKDRETALLRCYVAYRPLLVSFTSPQARGHATYGLGMRAEIELKVLTGESAVTVTELHQVLPIDIRSDNVNKDLLTGLVRQTAHKLFVGRQL